MNDQQTLTRPRRRMPGHGYDDARSPVELMAIREAQAERRRLTGTVKCGGGRRILGKKPGGDNY